MLHFSFLFLCFFPSSFFHFLSFFLVFSLSLVSFFLLSFFFPFLYLFSLFSCFTPLSLVFSFPFFRFLSLQCRIKVYLLPHSSISLPFSSRSLYLSPLFSCFAPLSLVSPFPFALFSFFLCFSLSFSLFLSLFFPSEIQNKFKIINPSSHSVYRKAYAYIPISSSLWIEPLYRNLRTTMLNFPGFRVEFVPTSYALL